MIFEHSHKLSGYIKWAVINDDGSVDKEGEHPNLILNSGLDLVASNLFGELSTYCAVGTDNTAPANTDTGLGVETARTNNYLTSPTGSCGSTWTSATEVVYKRTYDFPKGTLDGTYYEVGFSPESASGNNLFSRALFQVSGTPTGVAVSSTQILRVVYELTVTLSPATATAGTFDITGVGTIGYTHAIQKNGQESYVRTELLSGIQSTGSVSTSSSNTDPMALEPSLTSAINESGVSVYAASETLTLAAVGSAPAAEVAGERTVSTPQSYTSGNYYIDREALFDVTTANFTHYAYLLGVASQLYTDDFTAYAVRIDDTDVYTKVNTHELTITFRISWSRA